MAHLRASHKAFTLVEIMIVIAIIGIIIAIAVPAFLRARENARCKACQGNLAKIDAAIDMYAMDNKKNTGDPVTMDALVSDNTTGYLRQAPVCPSGGDYGAEFLVNDTPLCTIGVNTAAPYAPHVLQ